MELTLLTPLTVNKGMMGDRGQAAERKEESPPEDSALIRLLLHLLIGSQRVAGKFPLPATMHVRVIFLSLYWLTAALFVCMHVSLRGCVCVCVASLSLCHAHSSAKLSNLVGR